MKKSIKVILSFVAGIIMVSCSNDNDEITQTNGNGYEEKASIVLKLANEAVKKTKSIDDLQNDNTQNILQVRGTVNIFFFTATGALVQSDTPTAAELIAGKSYTNEDHGITTAVKEVIIIGNVGDISSGVTNKTSLHAKIDRLEKAQSDYIKATPDIWVYGSTKDINWEAQAAVNGVKQGECTVDMAPVLSRIDVTVNTSGITGGYEPDNLSSSNIDFKGVAVLYSGGYSHYTPDFMPTMSYLTSNVGPGVLPLRSGLVDDNYPLWVGTNQNSLLSPAVNDESILHATWNGQWNGNDNLDQSEGKFTRSFYAFPASKQNGFYDRNSVVTVYGDHHDDPGNADDKVTPLFWPVHFSSTQVLNGGTYSQLLENGKVYNLTINLKGDYTNGGNGTTDPDEESNPADLEVTIKQVKWKAVILMEIDFGN